MSKLSTSVKSLHSDVSCVSASINDFQRLHQVSVNHNRATLSLMKEIVDTRSAGGAAVPNSTSQSFSAPVSPDQNLKCPTCGKQNDSIVSLRKHIEIYHKQEPEIQVIQIACTKCDFKAHTLDQMKKHMKVRHFCDRKLLYVGDSVTMNVNFGLLERESQTAIRAVEANGTDSGCNTGNTAAFIDVIDDELKKDKFNTLVMAAGPTEISKLEMTKTSDAMLLREETVDIAKKVVSIAEAALENFPDLEKVILIRATPRFDPPSMDPAQLKPQLALLADSVLFGLWCESRYKDKIVLGNHDLSEWSKHNHSDIYGHSLNTGHDGVHLTGRLGRTVLTRSLLSVLRTYLTKKSPPVSCSDALNVHPYNPMDILRERILSNKDSPSFHHSRTPKHPSPPSSSDVPIPTGIAPPQFRQQKPGQSRQSVIFTAPPATSNRYSIPVSNQFDVLGNC